MKRETLRNMNMVTRLLQMQEIQPEYRPLLKMERIVKNALRMMTTEIFCGQKMKPQEKAFHSNMTQTVNFGKNKSI